MEKLRGRSFGCVLGRNAMLRAMLFVAVAGSMISAGSAGAQVMYEPVQYQYGGQQHYYYGGSDPAMHARAAGPSCGNWGRVNGFAFASGDVMRHREVSYERLRVYCDAYPLANAANYGMTPDDARNEAYRGTALYFCKGDLLGDGVVKEGTIAVPAQAGTRPRGTIEVRPYRMDRPTTQPAPATGPNPILIIPKQMLEKHLPAKQVAMAE
jgi:hypothetical protein